MFSYTKHHINNEMNIYFINIMYNTPEKDFIFWAEIVSFEKRLKVNKFRFFDDKKHSVYGELILRYTLVHDLGIKNEEIVIETTAYGKLYLKNIPIFFNISHSGEYVVCAIDSRPIGVDIEFIGKADVFVARKVFTLNECKQIFSREENMNTLFYEFWTLKESYVKYKGMGVSIPFESFSFSVNDEVIKMESIKEENLNFLSTIFRKKYCLSVCTEEKCGLNNVIQVLIDDLKVLKL